MEAVTPNVLVTGKVPETGLKLLREHCAVEVYEGQDPLIKGELIQRLKSKQALLCLLSDSVDQEVITSNPQLLVISNYAVGTNNIDVATATRLRIPVANTPGILTEATADLAWSLLMSLARRVVEGDGLVRAGQFKGWQPMLLLGTEVFGKTLGIIGMGRIGQAMARRAAGFQMRVLYTSRRRAEPSMEEELNARWVDLKTLLSESDFVTLHVPLSQETFHLINEEKLGWMQAGAMLINTSRGPVVDEQALVKSLLHNQLAGAGLDVFEKEPEVHPELLKMKNVVLTPHLGSATVHTREKMSEKAALNILAVLKCQRPAHLVNPEIYAGKPIPCT